MSTKYQSFINAKLIPFSHSTIHIFKLTLNDKRTVTLKVRGENRDDLVFVPGRDTGIEHFTMKMNETNAGFIHRVVSFLKTGGYWFAGWGDRETENLIDGGEIMCY